MKDSKFKNQVESLHKTFDKMLRSKDIVITPSRHERDFGEYVAERMTFEARDWRRADGMDTFIKPHGDVPRYVKDWIFKEGNEDIMRVAVQMAKVAEANGVGVNEFTHIFTMTLRMMKVNGSDWAS
jgi:hypothetical protein